jgi:hypothetical protein
MRNVFVHKLQDHILVKENFFIQIRGTVKVPIALFNMFNTVITDMQHAANTA